MTTIVTEVQNIIKEFDTSNTQFYQDYIKLASMYQELLDKGVVSKRESQLLLISDKATLLPIYFNHSD